MVGSKTTLVRQMESLVTKKSILLSILSHCDYTSWSLDSPFALLELSSSPPYGTTLVRQMESLVTKKCNHSETGLRVELTIGVVLRDNTQPP
jgi:hypothetical protein